MLGKLIKYELKSSLRTLVPLYIGTLIVATLCSLNVAYYTSERFLTQMNFGGMMGNGIFSAILFLLLFSLCVAMIVLTGMTIVTRFGVSLLGNEGYLMFTLPVTQIQLLWSKLLSAFFWSLISILVMTLSGVIISGVAIIRVGNFADYHFWNELQYLFSELGGGTTMLLSMGNGVASLASLILVIYLALMVGQMEQFCKYKIPVSVGAFFLIEWAFSTLDTIILWAMGYGASMMDLSFHALSPDSIIYGYMGYNLVLTLAEVGICFFAVIWLMRKKLNL